MSPSSDDSVVLKVITIYNKDTDTVEEVLLEELQVFQVQRRGNAQGLRRGSHGGAFSFGR